PLLIISLIYTLCYLPYCILYFSQFLFSPGYTLSVCSVIAFNIRYVSHSTNFYAYMFTCLRFRRDIKSLFRMLICVSIKRTYQRQKVDNYVLTPQPQRVMTKRQRTVVLGEYHSHPFSLPLRKINFASKRRIATNRLRNDERQALQLIPSQINRMGPITNSSSSGGKKNSFEYQLHNLDNNCKHRSTNHHQHVCFDDTPRLTLPPSTSLDNFLKAL
ncbi:unnamed protein product, partial [Didymodactylos carnosus]